MAEALGHETRQSRPRGAAPGIDLGEVTNRIRCVPHRCWRSGGRPAVSYTWRRVSALRGALVVPARGEMVFRTRPLQLVL